MTSIGDALKLATGQLQGAEIEEPRSEARHLMAHILDLNAAQVFAREADVLNTDNLNRFNAAVAARMAGTPFAHITGIREFWSLPFKVSPETLIPRPDTETILDLAIKIYADLEKPLDILDLGTGSGCLLCALMTVFKDARGVGVDLSAAALEIACQNAKSLKLENRTKWICSSWLENVDGQFDLIVSNPPYISSREIFELNKEVKDYEPHLALDGGPDGLVAYRYLIPESFIALKDEGVLIMEIGLGQAEDVTELAISAGFEVGRRQPDLSGIDRALSFYKKSGWNSSA